MGLIKDKDLDSVITGGEKLLGTDVDGTTINLGVTALAAFISSYIGATSESGGLAFTYDSPTSAGATAGTFRLNNVDPTLATKLYVSSQDSVGIDTLSIFDNIDAGSKVLIRQENQFELYEVTAGVNQSTYFEFTVTHLDSSSGDLTTSEATSFTFFIVNDTFSDTSLSASDQTVADTVTRVVDTINSGYLSLRQDGTELMRVGGNNDSAVYIRAIEAIPGNPTVPFVTPPQFPLVDTGVIAATDYNNALVQDTTDGNLYYSDGSVWYEINTLKNLSNLDQAVPASTDRTVNVSAGASTFLTIESNGTDVFRVKGNSNDRVFLDGVESLAGNNTIPFYTAPSIPEVDTGVELASAYSGAIVQDTGTVYYSDGTAWNALSAQDTSNLIVKDGSSPNSITNYYYGTQAQIDAISPKDANTLYIPSDGVSPATPKSTASATALSLETTGGHYYNMASANTATTYTITGTSVLGGWAKVRINASSEPSVTGATKSGGIAFAASTDMYMYVEYNGNRTEYWFAEY